MKNTYLKQLWLITKIWLIAVSVNTVFGAFWLTGFATKSCRLWDYMSIGVVWGAVFSFPVMIVLLAALNDGITANNNGLSLFRSILLSGVCFTVFMFFIFWALIGGIGSRLMVPLLVISVLSAILGVGSQCKSLLKWGSDFNKVQKYSHEN